MIPAALTIALAQIAALMLSGLWAERRLRRHLRLPMQWGLTGQPNWTAPRRVALATSAAFCALTPLIIAGVAAVQPAAARHDSRVLVELAAGTALVGLAVQALYIWLLLRWDRTH